MVNTLRIVWKALNSKALIVLFFVFIGSIYGTKSDRYFGWTNHKVKTGEPILADGGGYYAHLPQWFIYGTSNFQFLDYIGKKYPQSRFTNNVYVVGSGQPPANKYFTGSAIAMSPFFLTGHAIAKAKGISADGYSWPYLLMTNMALIFYALIAFLGIYYFLRKFAIDRFWILASLFLLALGTNLGYYIYLLTPYSHVFSFAVIAWLLFAAKCWADRHSAKSFIWLCALIGFAIIIRPTNVLAIAFIPFLFPSTKAFIERVKQLFRLYKMHLGAGLGIFVVFIFFQLWNVHLQSGKWAFNTYTNEKFEFLWNPKIIEVLFSWRKGLFIFAPGLLLMIPGWIVLFRRQRRLFWGSILCFALFTWITAAWWCWWYGGGLGMRPFIDAYALLIIPVAFLFQYSKAWMKGVLIALTVVGCWMGQVYEYQMKHNILHYDDMTYEQFSNVFMSKDLRYSWSMHLVYEELPKATPKQVIRMPFRMRGKQMPGNTFFKLFGDDYGDNPYCTIIPAAADSGYYFAAEARGEVFLYSGDSNPSFHIVYYKNGEIFRDNRFFIGQFIPEVGKLQPVRIAFHPMEQCAKIDSVKIEFEEGNTFTGIKNLRLTRYGY